MDRGRQHRRARAVATVTVSIISVFHAIPAAAQTAAPAGRGDASVRYVASLRDKLSSYKGATLSVSYDLIDTLAVEGSATFLHGTYSNIVTGAGGIVYNRMRACMMDPSRCSNINPNMPDTTQLTSSLDVAAVWTPVVLDALDPIGGSLEIFALAGVGMNGTRKVTATADPGYNDPIQFTVSGQDLGDGGFLADRELHLVVGGGVRAILFEHVNVRAEVRPLLVRREFELVTGGGATSYWYIPFFAHLGAGAVW
ncbi:MAG: hypothetical protein HY903_22990 [Deltaproteobacteria bacterium]|nr:hypothetical protein [Deltaproteobacteria bacterium]